MPVGTGRSHHRPMTADERAETIRRSMERLEQAIERRPGFGSTSRRSTTRIVDGLRCESQEDGFAIVTDLPPGIGGAASAPSPGALVRAALGSCLAMGYRLRCARAGVPLPAVTVTVESEEVLAGLLDIDSAAPPGFTELRVRVELTGAAPRAQLRQLVAEADRLSPVLDVLTRGLIVENELAVAEEDT